MFKFSGLGRTYWESSYFGGVKRILNEYPFYILNYDLHCYLDKGTRAYQELGVYQQEKLVNILLNQAFANRDNKIRFSSYLEDELIRTIRVERLFKERSVKKGLHNKLAIPISEKILKDFIAYLKDTELAELFNEYGQSLTDGDSKIVIMCDPPPPPKKDKGAPDPESKSGSAPPEKKEDMASSSKGESSEAKPEELTDSELLKYSHKIAEKFVSSFKDKKNVESFSVAVTNADRGRTTTFRSEEVIFAKKLHQMMDITHEPKADVIKNLLQGSMDSEKLAEVLSGNNRVYLNKLENQSLKPFKVIVLGDYSGSMDCHYRGGRVTKLDFQKGMLKSLFHLFHDLMGMEDVEFYGHSGNSDPILYRFHSPEYPHFKETIDDPQIPTMENYDGPVLEHIHKMTRLKTSKPVLLISLSDGQPSGSNYGGTKAIENMKRILEKIKRDNFITVGIGMLYTHTPDLYQYSVDVYDLHEVSPIARIINRAVKENLVVEE
jgi:hypothetical protein